MDHDMRLLIILNLIGWGWPLAVCGIGLAYQWYKEHVTWKKEE